MVKIVDVENEKILVAMDIHGNWEDYIRTMDKYKELRGKGLVDILILGGDLIHACGSYDDRSKDILDDLMERGDKGIIPLLGNHELVHIYHVALKHKDYGGDFVGAFENVIKGERKKYVDMMKDMPYAIRTKNGVLINHSGPSPAMAGFYRKIYEDIVKLNYGIDFLKGLNHDELLEKLGHKCEKEVEEGGFSELYSPDIGEAFLNSKEGIFLWDVFFNGNEYDEVAGRFGYRFILDRFLENMSSDGVSCKYIVSGHMPVEKRGYKVLEGRHLRVSLNHGSEGKHEKLLSVVCPEKHYFFVTDLINDLEPLY